MSEHSRRGFLGGGALALVAFGPVGVDTAAALDPDAVPDDPTYLQLLELLPAGEAVDAEYRTVICRDVDVEEGSEPSGYEVRTVTDALDIEPEELRSVVIAMTDDRGRFGVATGEFDSPLEDGEEVHGWRVGETDDLGVAAADGVAGYAAGADEREETAETMADAAAGEADRIVEDGSDTATALAALEAYETLLFLPAPDEAGFFHVGSDTLRALCAGFESYPGEFEGTAENEYRLLPAADADLEEPTVRSIIEEVDPGVLRELEVTESGGVVRADALVEAPPEYDREASPDARVRSEFDAEAGEVTLEHVDGEPISAADLQLWVDGERAAEGVESRLDTFETGETITVETGPVGTVVLRWFDGEENAHYVYAERTVDRDAVGIERDAEDETVEVTYTGERPADRSKLVVIHRGDEGIERFEDPFSGTGETVSSGETAEIEGVGMGDTVTVEVAVPEIPGVTTGSLARLHVSPPRLYLRSHPDEGVVARYAGDTERSAEEFELLVDGEAAETQFADERDTLAPDDRVALGEFPTGSTLTVEWGEDDPRVVAEHVVVPSAMVAVTYDGESGTVTVEHREGEALPAADLELRVDREPADTQPAERFEEFEPGDSFEASVPPLSTVKLVWVGDDGEHEHHLGGTMTGRDAISARYDPEGETMTLTYVGDRPADPDRLRVKRRTEDGESEDLGTAFADAHDELEPEDSIDVDAAVGDRIAVSVRTETENAVSVRSFGHFSTVPDRITVRQGEDGLEATYFGSVERDASEFRLLVDGDAAADRPFEAHGDIERGTTVDLGDYAAGTELAIEWTAPDDARTVGEHTVAPEATFDVAYDEGVVELTHDGGDAIPAPKLSVAAPPATAGEVEWDGDGDVERGDSTTVEVDERPELVVVLYDGGTVLHREEIGEE